MTPRPSRPIHYTPSDLLSSPRINPVSWPVGVEGGKEGEHSYGGDHKLASQSSRPLPYVPYPRGVPLPQSLIPNWICRDRLQSIPSLAPSPYPFLQHFILSGGGGDAIIRVGLCSLVAYHLSVLVTGRHWRQCTRKVEIGASQKFSYSKRNWPKRPLNYTLDNLKMPVWTVATIPLLNPPPYHTRLVGVSHPQQGLETIVQCTWNQTMCIHT